MAIMESIMVINPMVEATRRSWVLPDGIHNAHGGFINEPHDAHELVHKAHKTES
jgi:hypothetical protein